MHAFNNVTGAENLLVIIVDQKPRLIHIQMQMLVIATRLSIHNDKSIIVASIDR